MPNRLTADKSPFHAGLVHGFLSLVVFGGVAGLVGGAVHIIGDPEEAGPRHVIALFHTEPAADTAPKLRPRASLLQARASSIEISKSALAEGDQSDEPSLGIANPDKRVIRRLDGQGGLADAAPRGIRINGKLVGPGQTLSQFEEQANAPATVTINTATTPANAVRPPNPKARPFANPEGKPIVSLVIGGLGNSYRQTIAAIDELPADVTLSFIPTANSELLRYARQKGHEVLLELPMEAYGYGRSRPHRDTLLATAPADQNLLRLDSLLRGQTEIYGVISDKGDKFITSNEVGPVMLGHLSEKGLAFFAHGTLGRNTFGADAADLNIEYAAAEENIDTDISASAIEAQLFKLETQARENGSALGTGFSFPLTVDTVSRWSHRLAEKGILLAPASAVAAAGRKPEPSFQTSKLETPAQGADVSP